MSLKVIRLEERIVLEAAAVAAIDHVVDTYVDPLPEPAADSGGEPQGIAPDAEGTADGGLRVLAVSSSVQDAEVLANSAVEGVLTYVYDGDSSNLDAILADITEMLGGQQADSIAFATHDLGAGQFHLAGEHSVDTYSLLNDAELQSFWQGVGSLVAEDGRVDVIACDVAGTAQGLELLSQLESLTGADVAASDDATGNPAQGGDWVLETHNVNLVGTYLDADGLVQFDDLLAAQDKVWADTSQENNAVATDGEWLIVGSPDSNGSDGVVKIFRHVGTEWQEFQTLQLGDVAGSLPSGLLSTRNGSFDVEGFGASVAVSGDKLVIGASETDYEYEAYRRHGFMDWRWDAESLDDVGAAFTYTFDGNSWVLEQMLTSAGNEFTFSEYAQNQFGFDVAIDG
ncbi:MAG: DUF4347 domain-containing protein, partial [Desulfovibrio sp.]